MMWKTHFDERSLTKGVWYSSIQCEPPHVPWFSASKLSRQLIVTAHRLRSGHYPSKSFAYMMRKSNSPICDKCGKPDDLQHVLTDCVRFATKRTHLITKLGLNNCNIGMFHGILSNPNSLGAKMLYDVFN
jgi:hypothetical protein